jgi:hypothetical protein
MFGWRLFQNQGHRLPDLLRLLFSLQVGMIAKELVVSPFAEGRVDPDGVNYI